MSRTDKVYKMVVSVFAAISFIFGAANVIASDINAEMTPELGEQADSWKNTGTLLTTPYTGEYLYDVEWHPGKEYAVMVGGRQSMGGSYAVSYRMMNNKSTFDDRFVTTSAAWFYGIDFKPAPAGTPSPFALVVGRQNIQEFAIWKTLNGTSYENIFVKASGGDLIDVDWSPAGDHALAVGYYGTSLMMGKGVIYKIKNTTSATPPADITPPWLTQPLFCVAFMHHAPMAFIGGKNALYAFDGTDIFLIENNTDFNCYDAEYSPDDRYLLLAGQKISDGSGLVYVIDTRSGLIDHTTNPTPLRGGSWKSTGNIAVITGDNGVLMTYSDGIFKTYPTGTTRNLMKSCWMNPGWNPLETKRYEYNLIVGSGGGGGGGARVIKFRQNDADNGATAARDSLTDAVNTIPAGTIEMLTNNLLYKGYLDANDKSDFYRALINTGDIIIVSMTPYETADYFIRLYDSSYFLVKEADLNGAGVAETLLYDIGLTGGFYYIEIANKGGSGTYDFKYNAFTNTKPSAVIVKPGVKSSISGNTTYNIKISIAGGIPPYTIDVNYSTDGGLHYDEVVVSGYTTSVGDVSIPWNVPPLNSGTVRLAVRVTDSAPTPNTNMYMHPDNFAIDSTEPAVASTYPADGTTNVPVDQSIFISFSERMNTKVNPTDIVEITPITTGLSWYWNATGNGLIGCGSKFVDGTTYTVRVNATTAKDASEPGNALKNPYAFSFTTGGSTALTVHLDKPNGNENWTTGSVQNISWSIYGGTPPFKSTLEYSIDSGSHWTAIVTDTAQPSPYLWTLPDVPSSHDCLVRVSVSDSSPMPVIASDESDANFTIWNPTGNLYPYITSTSPYDGESGVPVTRTIFVKFSKEMNISSLNYSCTPDPGGWSVQWTDGNSSLHLKHNDFAHNTNYTFEIKSAKDTEGNPLAPSTSAPNPFTFRTEKLVAPRITNTTPANGAVGVDIGQPIVVSFSNQMNTSTLKFTCTPDPGGWMADWSASDRKITLTHADFSHKTHYIFNITEAEDIFGQKLSPGSSNPFSFTTIPEEKISRVDIAPYPSIVIKAGDGIAFSAAAYDSNGNLYMDEVEYSWSVTNTSIGSITPNTGQNTLFTAISPGACTIEVVASHITGTVTNKTEIKVVAGDPKIDTVEISPPTATLKPGETSNFIAKAYNGSFELAGASFHWTISNSIIGILSGADSQTVTFLAQNRGTAILQVNASYKTDMKSASVSIIVIQPIARLELSPPTPTPLRWNSQMTFTATAYDENSKAIISGVNYTWNVSGAIGTLSSSTGQSVTLTTGMTSASGKITVQAEGFAASANITVLNDMKPVIEHQKISQWDANRDIVISANVTDDFKVEKVSIFYRKSSNGKWNETWTELAMTRSGLSNFSASIKSSELTGDIQYYITATDDRNQTSQSGSRDDPYSVHITGIKSDFEINLMYILAILLIAIILSLIIIAAARRKKKSGKPDEDKRDESEKVPVSFDEKNEDMKALESFLRGEQKKPEKPQDSGDDKKPITKEKKTEKTDADNKEDKTLEEIRMEDKKPASEEKDDGGHNEKEEMTEGANKTDSASADGDDVPPPPPSEPEDEAVGIPEQEVIPIKKEDVTPSMKGNDMSPSVKDGTPDTKTAVVDESAPQDEDNLGQTTPEAPMETKTAGTEQYTELEKEMKTKPQSGTTKMAARPAAAVSGAVKEPSAKTTVKKSDGSFKPRKKKKKDSGIYPNNTGMRVDV